MAKQVLVAENLNSCLTAWRSSLEHDKYLMSPATVFLVEATVKFLEQLQELKYKEN